MKLIVALESYKHFHTIEVHEERFIISENTVLTYFSLTDETETFGTKRSWLILDVIKISALSVKQKYVNTVFSLIMKHLYAWEKKTNVHVLAKQIMPDCSSQGLSEYV